MNAKILFYRQDELDQNTKFRLRRELLGLEQKSNFGGYNYKIKGFLDKIPHYRPVKSTIIIRNEDVNKTKAILSKYGTKLEIFNIEIPKNKLKK